MGTLDIILLICFIPALIQGVTKGFVGQLVSLVSIVLGGWLAFRFSSALSAWALTFIKMDAKLMNIICFAVIVILVILILSMLGKFLTKLFKLAMLGWLNRVLGILFAIFKAALLLGLVITMFEGINGVVHIVRKEVLDGSVIYGALRNFADSVFPFLKSLITNA